MSANNPLLDVTIEQLPERLREAAARAGWTALMPVQARGIPYMLAARNMMIQARTGSGKTGGSRKQCGLFDFLFAVHATAIINQANGIKCIIIRMLSCNPHKIAHT